MCLCVWPVSKVVEHACDFRGSVVLAKSNGYVHGGYWSVRTWGEGGVVRVAVSRVALSRLLQI